MIDRVRIPRDLHAKPLHERAVTRYYRLLDTGVVRQDKTTYGGQDAAEAVAQEFNVPCAMVWRWVREHADKQSARKELTLTKSQSPS